MEKIIGLKEADFQKMENGYNFIIQNKEEIYNLIQSNKTLSEEFKNLFFPPKLKTLQKHMLSI